MTTFDVTEEWKTVRIPFDQTIFDWKGQQIKDMPKIKPEVLKLIYLVNKIFFRI